MWTNNLPRSSNMLNKYPNVSPPDGMFALSTAWFLLWYWPTLHSHQHPTTATKTTAQNPQYKRQQPDGVTRSNPKARKCGTTRSLTKQDQQSARLGVVLQASGSTAHRRQSNYRSAARIPKHSIFTALKSKKQSIGNPTANHLSV